jgi:tRNA threonylcarbamoyladenosine biosynthesis protein TsaE
MSVARPATAGDAAADLQLTLADEDAMAHLGGLLARALRGGEYIALRGPLGAGKTTLARALLRASGHVGPVRSPTFTLVEPYSLAAFQLLHLDLYRLGDAEELEMLGVRERFGDAVVLIEWPERGAGWLPPPDLELLLDFADEGRTLVARAAPAGAHLLAGMRAAPGRAHGDPA